jgi:hypothetical protein
MRGLSAEAGRVGASALDQVFSPSQIGTVGHGASVCSPAHNPGVLHDGTTARRRRRAFKRNQLPQPRYDEKSPSRPQQRKVSNLTFR